MSVVGTEVGRITVKVTPDTTGFRYALKRQLEALDKGIKLNVDEGYLKKELGKATKDLPDAKIGLDVDADKAIAKAQKAVSKPLAVDIKPKVKGLDRFQQRYLAKIQKLMSEVELNIPLAPGGEKQREKFKRLEKNFNSSVKSLDLKADEEELARLRRGIDKFYNNIRRQASEAKLLNADNSDAVKRAAQSIKDFAKIDIETLVNWDSFQKAAQKTKADTEKLFSDLDVKLMIRIDEKGNPRHVWQGLAREARLATQKIANGVGDALEGVSKAFKNFSPESLIQGAAIIAAVAALAAPAVALLSGALLTLPAALTAIAAPIGVVALGIEGVKKAAETAKPAFEDLRSTISKVFEDDLKPGFEMIRDQLIPGLKTPMESMAKALSGAFNGVVETLSNGALQNLQKTFDSISQAITTSVPGLQSFTNGLAGLISGVASRFPEIAQSFNSIGRDFDQWISKITSNGELNTAFDSLKGTLSEIGGMFKDIGKWGFDLLADPKFGNSMKEFASDLRSIVNSTLPLLKSGFEDIAQITDGIRAAIDGIKDVGNFIERITGGARQDIDKTAKQTEGFLGLFGKDGLLGEKAPFRQWFSDAPTEAQEAGRVVAENFGKSLSGSTVAGGDITQAIQTQLGQITSATNEAQKAALRSVFTGDGVGEAVRAQMSTQLQGILTEAQTLVSTLGPQLQTSLDAAMQPLTQLPVKIGETFGVVAASVMGSWGQVITTVATGAQQVVTAVQNSFTMLPNAISGPMLQITSIAAQGVQSVATAFGTMGAEVNRVISTSFSQIPPLITETMNSVVQAVTAGSQQCVEVVSALPGQMAGALSAGAGALTPAGVALMAGLKVGLVQGMQDVLAYASSIAGQIAAVKGPLPKDKKELIPAGLALMDGLTNGIEQGMVGVLESAKQIARQVFEAFQEVFGQAPNLSFNFGGGGLTAGMSSIASSAQSFQKSMTNAVNPAKKIDATSKAQISDLTRQISELEMERKALELARANDKNNPAIKARLEEIRQQKLSLGLQKDQLNYAAKYGGAVSEVDEIYGEQFKKLQKMPWDVGLQAGREMLSDFGIEGQGAISGLVNQGLDYASKFIFNVSNVDEAMAVQRNQTLKESQQYITR